MRSFVAAMLGKPPAEGEILVLAVFEQGPLLVQHKNGRYVMVVEGKK